VYDAQGDLDWSQLTAEEYGAECDARTVATLQPFVGKKLTEELTHEMLHALMRVARVIELEKLGLRRVNAEVQADLDLADMLARKDS
jgi:hypothetical protein